MQLETPTGCFLWDTEARLMQLIGLQALPPIFQLKAFGDFSIVRSGAPEPLWPRKKAFSFLALLVLHPDGVASTTLAKRLFNDPDAQASLHVLVGSVRQVFKAEGAEGLLESSRGGYRLKWTGIAFCDVHEFDAFYQKAQSLEADGIPKVAATFYQLALLLVEGELFANIPDEFETEREQYRECIRYANAFVKQHALTST